MELTPERLQLAQLMQSIITLAVLAYAARLLWRKVAEVIRTAYIGLRLLSSRKRYEMEVEERLDKYLK